MSLFSDNRILERELRLPQGRNMDFADEGINFRKKFHPCCLGMHAAVL